MLVTEADDLGLIFGTHRVEGRTDLTTAHAPGHVHTHPPQRHKQKKHQNELFGDSQGIQMRKFYWFCSSFCVIRLKNVQASLLPPRYPRALEWHLRLL